MQALRNVTYVLLQLLLTPVFAFIICASFWAPPKARNELCAWYTRLFIWLAKHLCRINYVVEGWENVPKTPFIVLSKHSSTWETLMLESVFTPGSFVAKKELLWVPFFGWGFACSSPITIDRKAGAKSISGTSQGFGLTPCTARPGRPRARPPSSSAPGNASRSRRPRLSTPQEASGLRPTRVR